MQTTVVASEERIELLSRTMKDAGPIVMINLLRFREEAAYPDGFDAEPCSGREAYARYGAVTGQLIGKHGGRPIFAGQVALATIAPDGEDWDDAILVEYPSVAAFREMIESPEYLAVSPHRTAALVDARLLATTALMDGATIVGSTKPLRVSNSQLSGSSFDDVDLADSTISNANAQGLRMMDIDLSGATISDANLQQLAIRDANLDGMTINGVAVADLLSAYEAQNGAAKK